MTFRLLIFLSILSMYFSCDTRTPKDLSAEAIIPKPTSVVATNSSFVLSQNSGIFYNTKSKELKSIGQSLANLIKPTTGFSFAVQGTESQPSSGNIFLDVNDANAALGDEGYELSVTEDLVTISASSAEGVFRGIQTLRQILPVGIESVTNQEGHWEIATGTITDKPTFAYRGAMLDVARHFFQVEEVKRYIDHLAVYKFNALHLHLSDDQGWRIEIKSWPKLTTHGGSTQVGGGNGGFFTQDQYKDIVAYAADRFITIVPEIDMPGHTNAALASYAELNCDGKATELYSGIEVGFSSLCTDKEITYKFIDDVVRELAEITPGPYIHIGGDESHATPLEDYIPFINRVQDIVIKYDKKVMGWDEVAHASLAPNSIIQYWAKAENALKGIEQGAQVLVSPATKTYVDMQYDSTTQYGLHWAAYIEVDDAYNWDPTTMVEGMDKQHILGIEAPLWSETITNIKEIEFMAFPRIVCIAEVGWTPMKDRNWDDFKLRLGSHKARFDAMNINYYPSDRVPWK